VSNKTQSYGASLLPVIAWRMSITRVFASIPRGLNKQLRCNEHLCSASVDTQYWLPSVTKCVCGTLFQ